MNVVSVRINGIEYNLKGEEPEEYLLRTAAYLDKKIKGILGKNCMLNTSSAAVLSALNVVDDLFKTQKELNRFKDYVQDIENKHKVSEDQTNELKNQVKELAVTNSQLMEKLRESVNRDLFNEMQEELDRLRKEITVLEENARKNVEKTSALKAENKELKFQLHSSKYKVMDLQNKLMESQINFVKEKKINTNPLIKNEG